MNTAKNMGCIDLEKVRVYELAKELNTTSKRLIGKTGGDRHHSEKPHGPS